MQSTKFFVILCLCACAARATPPEPPPELFTELIYAASDMSPPPIDSLAIWYSTLNVTGLASMPTKVAVHIPADQGDVAAVIDMERMLRREGFGPRDPYACVHGDINACEIIPIPGFPTDQFSYTWIGRGDGYDLRLTVHHGNAVGVLSGPQGRFGITWDMLKELRVEYFLTDDSIVYTEPSTAMTAASPPASPSTVPTLNPAAVQAAALARIEPNAAQATLGAGSSQLDMLVLFTEKARLQAGGNPSDCRDTSGIMTYVYQNVTSIDTAFQRSLVPAQIGVVTVARLNGYTLIPYTPGQGTIIQNRNNIQGNVNIRAFRNIVGADVVSTLLDTQAHLGTCGVAYIQRPGCGGSASGCGIGQLFSNWTYLLETVQCAIMDTFTHELGHVLGAEHDPTHTSATPSTASFPYSFGYGFPSPSVGFETMMSQQFNAYHPTRLLQFSNPSVYYQGRVTGNASSADNAHTLSNLLPGTAAFRVRPDLIFASGFDENDPCPAINY